MLPVPDPSCPHTGLLPVLAWAFAAGLVFSEEWASVLSAEMAGELVWRNQEAPTYTQSRPCREHRRIAIHT
jgi:hypothetical protein